MHKTTHTVGACIIVTYYNNPLPDTPSPSLNEQNFFPMKKDVFCIYVFYREFHFLLIPTYNVQQKLFRKTFLLIKHKNLSPHSIHYVCTGVFHKSKREGKMLIQGCVVLQSFNHQISESQGTATLHKAYIGNLCCKNSRVSQHSM